MNATEIITSLNKWNAKQVFRQEMVKGNGYLIRSALKRADSLKSFELYNKVLLVK